MSFNMPMTNNILETNKSFYLKKNNFNLLRIFAAIQVFLTHGIQHLHIKNEVLLFIYYKILFYFPGVPVFYTISGFLIYASFEKNNNDIKNFYFNRFLRIYPGLIICLLFTTILLYFDFQGSVGEFFSFSFFKWFLAQLSFFQFYTPDIFRFWGVGTPNGSLWTISVEIQFYLTIPFIYYLFKKANKNKFYLLALFLISVLINLTFNERETPLQKLYYLFIFKYLYYFLFGVFAYIYWDNIYKYFVNKFIIITIIYVLFFVFIGNYLEYDITSYLIKSPFGLPANFILSLWVLASAFSFRDVSGYLLKKSDLSYGIYIYHMPIINYLNHHALINKIGYLVIAFIIVMICAWFSWKLIEERFLLFKRKKIIHT